MTESKVLIVEDDESIRTLYATALKVAGLKVLTASDGKEGVTLALEHHPDVIMMDIMMPNMSGHDAVEKIRLDKWGKNVKIIFLTNHSDPKNVFEAVKAGSDDYIVKANTDVKEVVNRVRAAMHL